MSSISQAIFNKLNPRADSRPHSINGVPTNVYWVNILLDRHVNLVKVDIDVDDTPLLGRDVLNHYRQVYDPPNGLVQISYSG